MQNGNNFKVKQDVNINSFKILMRKSTDTTFRKKTNQMQGLEALLLLRWQFEPGTEHNDKALCLIGKAS